MAAALVLGACMPGADTRISTVAGAEGPGFAGDGGPAVDALVHFPDDVDVDSLGNVVIADDRNRRVRRIDAVTGVITTIAGDGTSAYDGDDQPATTAALYPLAVAFDADDNLFIAEPRRIRRVDATTGMITTVAGDGVGGSWVDESDEGQSATSVGFSHVSGIDVAPDGDLVLADTGNSVILRVDADTGTIGRVAGNPDVFELADGVPARDVQLDDLRYVTVGPNGSLYFTTMERVHRVDPAGIITTIAGNGEWGFTGDGGPAVDAQVSHPNEMAVDAAGNVYLADGENNRVRLITAETGVISTVVGTGEYEFNGDDITALDANLQFIQGIALAPDGSLYLAMGNRIRKVTVGGAVGGIVRESASQPLAGIPVELYASDDLTTPIATDTTDGGGWYGFSVRPGSYRVRFVGDATHQGSWWAGAATGGSSTPVDITTGSLAGPTDSITANATLADR